MDENDFWVALEYRVCHELAGDEECARLGLWCDGFIPDEVLDLGTLPQRISGRAWICQGRDQEPWRFELILPTAVGRPDEIRWPVLLPAEDVTGWLTVDRGRRLLVVAPGAAVPDAHRTARQPRRPGPRPR